MNKRAETVREICNDIGINEGRAIDYLAGLHKHPLELYGITKEIAEHVGKLYRIDGYVENEISTLLSIDEDLIKECIDEFFYTYEDAELHNQNRLEQRKTRETKPIKPVKEDEDTAHIAAKRKEASSSTAAALDIDEDAASRFFDDGFLPTRAELFKKTEARKALSEAMFDQGKSLKKIAKAVGVGEKTVEGYLGNAYLPIKEAIQRERINVNPTEAAIGLYRKMFPSMKQQGSSGAVSRLSNMLLTTV